MGKLEKREKKGVSEDQGRGKKARSNWSERKRCARERIGGVNTGGEHQIPKSGTTGGGGEF